MDTAKALSWFRKAAAQGHQKALGVVAELGAMQSPPVMGTVECANCGIARALVELLSSRARGVNSWSTSGGTAKGCIGRRQVDTNMPVRPILIRFRATAFARRERNSHLLEIEGHGLVLRGCLKMAVVFVPSPLIVGLCF